MSDPLKKLTPKRVPSEDDLRKEITQEQQKDVKPFTPTEEIAKLKEQLSSKGTELEALQKIAANQKAALTIEQAAPGTLQAIWDTAHREALRSIFAKGLTYWSSKEKSLKNHLELSAIRADEAVEAYIAVRKTFPDPVQKQLQDWQKNKDVSSKNKN